MLRPLVITFFVTLAFIVSTEVGLGWEWNPPKILVLVVVTLPIAVIAVKRWYGQKSR